MSWENVKLGDIVKMVTGKTPPTSNLDYFDGDYLWVNPSDFGSKYISESKRTITQKAIDEKKCNLLPKGTILLSCIGDIGKIGILKTHGAFNQQITGLIAKENVFPDYLFYYLIHNKSKLESLANKAVVAILNNERLRDLDVILPSLPIQMRVAEILDAADVLQRKDQVLLKKYDKLAQAIFIDMFGDPVKNEKGWEEVEIVNCCLAKDDVRCGPFGTQLLQSEFVSSGIPLWGIKHTNSGFKKLTHEFLTSEKALELNNYTIIKGDIVMTRKGTIGNCSVYEFDNFGIMHSDLLRIRVNNKICNPYFLSFQFKHSQKIINQIEQISHGAIMSGINVSKLKHLSILLPPIELQHRFKLALDIVSNSKKNLLKDKTNYLFNSIIQKAFNGELVAE